MAVYLLVSMEILTTVRRLAQTRSVCFAFTRDMGKGKKESVQAPAVEWEVGKLAELWEADTCLRARARTSDCLTKWPSPKSKGVASMAALRLNGEVMVKIAQLWCPLLAHAKSPPIPVIRSEASNNSLKRLNNVCRIEN